MRRNIFFVFFILLASFTLLFSTVSQKKSTCEWLEKPVDNKTFKAFMDFFKYDKDLPFEIQILNVKEHEGIRKEHLSFLSASNERVFANLYSASETSSERDPALIFLHGGGATGKDQPRYEVYSELLARAGFKTLVIDLKYFGERSTDLLMTFGEKEKHEKLYNKHSAYLSWMIQNVKDISRSVDFLIDQRGADPEHISLIGFSRGAVVAAVAGGAEQRLSSVVLLHGGHFDAMEKEHLPAACPSNYIGRISPRPLLMINGTRDADFAMETSILPLYNLAKIPKKIIWLEGGHGAWTEEADSELLKWLQDHAK